MQLLSISLPLYVVYCIVWGYVQLMQTIDQLWEAHTIRYDDITDQLLHERKYGQHCLRHCH